MDRLKETDELMKEAVTEGVFPSASLLVAKSGEIILKENYGDSTPQTIFDVASLTKPVITTTLLMRAVSEGFIKLDDKVEKFIPSTDHLKSVTIANLLNHSSGLPAWQPFYQEVPRQAVASVAGRKHIIDAVLEEALEYETGSKSVYSDLGFILLGAILEGISSKPLNSLADEAIITPLKMKDSFYRPINKTPWSEHDFKPAYMAKGRDFEGIEFAPTEDCPWRDQVIKGFVHDQNCYAMGGVAGHAGLFSTVEDLYIFISAIRSSMDGKSDFVQKAVIDQFIDPYTSTLAFRPSGTFLLGWDRPQHENSQAGHRFSERSIGHLGYTGCSLWIDLEKEVWMILLTNRVHPSTTNNKIKAFRPMLHDRIWEELGV